jgi:hypothetical protein
LTIGPQGPFQIGVEVDEQHPKSAVTDRQGFRVSWTGDLAKQFAAEAGCFSLRVGQRVRLNGNARMWDSIGVFAEGQPDGTLVVRVVILNPDWDEPLQIACIRSRPDDAASLTALGCNLNHVTA